MKKRAANPVVELLVLEDVAGIPDERPIRLYRSGGVRT
jgi:hypothetical protein